MEYGGLILSELTGDSAHSGGRSRASRVAGPRLKYRAGPASIDCGGIRFDGPPAVPRSMDRSDVSRRYPASMEAALGYRADPRAKVGVCDRVAGNLGRPLETPDWRSARRVATYLNMTFGHGSSESSDQPKRMFRAALDAVRRGMDGACPETTRRAGGSGPLPGRADIRERDAARIRAAERRSCRRCRGRALVMVASGTVLEGALDWTARHRHRGHSDRRGTAQTEAPRAGSRGIGPGHRGSPDAPDSEAIGTRS